MSMTKDILLKAAEDVQSGMWCRGEWFDDRQVREVVQNQWSEHDGHPYRAHANVTTEQMAASPRCAEGSLIYATRLLGGGNDDYEQAEQAALNKAKRLHLTDGDYLSEYNDALPDDPFEAGQQLAELFRSTAEAL